MSNNPLKYTDPTGHMQASDDYQDSDGKCAQGDKGCNDLVAKITKKRKTLNVHEMTDKGYFQSWEGEQNIDPDAWQDILSDTRDLVHSTSGPALLFQAAAWDTRFYNDRSHLSGQGCLGVKCYDRSELNYIAQGEIWAALGLSQTETNIVVTAWKGVMYDHSPSKGAYEMTSVGWEDYRKNYPSSRQYLILSPNLWQTLKNIGEEQ